MTDCERCKGVGKERDRSCRFWLSIRPVYQVCPDCLGLGKKWDSLPKIPTEPQPLPDRWEDCLFPAPQNTPEETP